MPEHADANSELATPATARSLTLTERVYSAADGLRTLLVEADAARVARAEASGADGAGAVCAWNHFENIPTFYNWNNRPR